MTSERRGKREFTGTLRLTLKYNPLSSGVGNSFQWECNAQWNHSRAQTEDSTIP